MSNRTFYQSVACLAVYVLIDALSRVVFGDWLYIVGIVAAILMLLESWKRSKEVTPL